MTHYETAVEELITPGELTGLAKATGPCISATLSIPDPSHLRPETNRLIRELEKQMKDAQIDTRTAQTLLEPLRELAVTIETDGDWAVALAIYRSPETFHCFRAPEITKELTIIEEVFEIRPLLPVVSREQRFYLLALSQKKVRLFDCSHYRIHEIELDDRVPRNLRVFVNVTMPDHVLDPRGMTSPGSGTDRDKRDEYLTHFFKEIDKGLHKILGGDTAPLLLAGVEYEIAIYRTINSYKDLMEHEMRGSPDGFTPRQMHQRAIEIVKTGFSSALRKVMRELPSHRDANRVVFNLTDILDAGYKGRISHLLVREDAEGRELNLAALRTLAHGGEVYALQESEMPDHADIAAVMRY